MSNLKQTTNEVVVAGQLLKNNLTIAKGDSCQCIRGSLVIRTIDGSEVEVGYYANEFKKDKNSNGYSTERNGLYDSLLTVCNEYKSFEKFKEEADFIKISSASFDVNDYKGQDGVLRTGTRLKANFANRITDAQKETTPLTATFQVEGIITLVDDEMYKDEPTGRVKVNINMLGYQGAIIPLSLVAPAEYADHIKANYTEGNVAKFWGKIINTTETRTETQQGGFGESFTKTFTTTVKRYEITGGNPQMTLDEANINEDEYIQAKSKRKLKLDNLLKEEKKTKNSEPTQGGFGTSGNPFGATGSTGGNPFAGSNPFGA